MPFTFAHPIVVLPFLKRKYFSATGLIVGSIVPDFEYFLKMSAGGQHGHTLAGMFYFDLPLSFVLALVFHSFIKETFLDNCPTFLQNRFVDLRQFNFKAYLKEHYWIFMYSVLLGAGTHLMWDSFTHSGGFMVTQVEFLYKTKVPFQGVRYPLWYSLQHFFSVSGLIIMIVYVVSMKSQQAVYQSPSWLFWMFLATVTSLTFYLRYIFGPAMNEGNSVVAFVSAFFIGLFVAVFVFRRFTKSPKLKA